ncbi:MAG: hypothetical protein KDC98_00075, partial [Planctomycetes bacterium]|nr:hypothetical protein [Planctomycetota bacterium]
MPHQLARSAPAALLILLAAIAPVSPATAQIAATSPPQLATIEGNNNDQAPLGAIGQRRFQMVLGPDELRGFAAGTLLSGIRFRVDGSAGGLPAQTVANYEIRLSQSANPPGSLSLVFAANRGADEVMVRSGPLVIAAGGYPVGGSPNGFGPFIAFATPYRYRGGALLIEIAHDGFPAGGVFADSEYPATTSRQAAYGSSFNGVAADLGAYPAAPVLQLRACSTDIVTPAPLAANEGNNSDQAPLGGIGQRRFQMVIGATDLAALPVGAEIRAIRFRADAQVSALAAQTVANYEIRLSQSANPPGSLSTTFANNRGTDELTVRSGALVIRNGDYPTGGLPNAFGPLIEFDRAYTYRGGPLLVEIAHDGFPAGGVYADSEYPATTSRQAAYGSAFTSVSADLGIYAAAPVLELVAQLGRVTTTPAAAATIEMNNNDQAPLGAIGQRRFQMVLGASDLGPLAVGNFITGLQFRVDGGAAAPPPQTVANYEIRLSQSVNPPGALASTFAANRGVDEVVVRSGALPIRAGDYPGGSSPNDFGPVIAFDTAYRYRGGPLLIEIAHDGFPAGGVFA